MRNLPFDLQDIADLEQAVITAHHLDDCGRLTFKEDTAWALYQDRLADNSNTRVVLYAGPLVAHLMFNQANLLRSSNLGNTFQALSLKVLSKLPSYSPANGQFYTYLTLVVSDQLHELALPPPLRTREGCVVTTAEQEEDTITDDYDRVFELDDLLTYLPGEIGDCKMHTWTRAPCRTRATPPGGASHE
jgi:hypothetical protein